MMFASFVINYSYMMCCVVVEQDFQLLIIVLLDLTFVWCQNNNEQKLIEYHQFNEKRLSWTCNEFKILSFGNSVIEI